MNGMFNESYINPFIVETVPQELVNFATYLGAVEQTLAGTSFWRITKDKIGFAVCLLCCFVWE